MCRTVALERQPDETLRVGLRSGSDTFWLPVAFPDDEPGRLLAEATGLRALWLDRRAVDPTGPWRPRVQVDGAEPRAPDPEARVNALSSRFADERVAAALCGPVLLRLLAAMDRYASASGRWLAQIAGHPAAVLALEDLRRQFGLACPRPGRLDRTILWLACRWATMGSP